MSSLKKIANDLIKTFRNVAEFFLWYKMVFFRLMFLGYIISFFFTQGIDAGYFLLYIYCL